MHGKFCLQPLHVHFRFWVVSSFRADNRAGKMLVHSIQKLSSQTQHDMHSCSCLSVTSHFGHVLLPTLCLLLAVLDFTMGVKLARCAAIILWWFIFFDKRFIGLPYQSFWWLEFFYSQIIGLPYSLGNFVNLIRASLSKFVQKSQ
jgi:hypothetical protein